MKNKEVDYDDVRLLNFSYDKTFVPRGMTALYYAVGKTIATVSERLSKTTKSKMPAKDDNTRGLSLRDNDFILTFGTYKFKLVKLFYNNKYRFISSELSFQDVEYTPFKSFNTIDQCISDAFLYVKEIQIIEKDNQDE